MKILFILTTLIFSFQVLAEDQRSLYDTRFAVGMNMGEIISPEDESIVENYIRSLLDDGAVDEVARQRVISENLLSRYPMSANKAINTYLGDRGNIFGEYENDTQMEQYFQEMQRVNERILVDLVGSDDVSISDLNRAVERYRFGRSNSRIDDVRQALQSASNRGFLASNIFNRAYFNRSSDAGEFNHEAGLRAAALVIGEDFFDQLDRLFESGGGNLLIEASQLQDLSEAVARGAFVSYLVSEKDISPDAARSFVGGNISWPSERELLRNFVESQGRIPIEVAQSALDSTENWNYLRDLLREAGESERYELIRSQARNVCPFQPPTIGNQSIFSEIAELGNTSRQVQDAAGRQSSECDENFQRFTNIAREVQGLHQVVTRRRSGFGNPYGPGGGGSPGFGGETNPGDGGGELPGGEGDKYFDEIKQVQSANEFEGQLGAGEEAFGGASPITNPTLPGGPSLDPATFDRYYTRQADLATSLQEFMSSGCQLREGHGNFVSTVTRFASSLAGTAASLSGSPQVTLLAQAMAAGSRLITAIMDLFRGPTEAEIIQEWGQDDQFTSQYEQTMCNLRTLLYNVDESLANGSPTIARALEIERQTAIQLQQEIAQCEAFSTMGFDLGLISDIESLDLDDFIDCGEFVNPILQGSMPQGSSGFYTYLNDNCGDQTSRESFCSDYDRLVSFIDSFGDEFNNGDRLCTNEDHRENINQLVGRLKSTMLSNIRSQTNTTAPSQALVDMRSQLENTNRRIAQLEGAIDDSASFNTALDSSLITNFSPLFLDESTEGGTGPLRRYFENIESQLERERDEVRQAYDTMRNSNRSGSSCDAAISVVAGVRNMAARRNRARGFCQSFDANRMVPFRSDDGFGVYAGDRLSMQRITGYDNDSNPSDFYQQCERFEANNPGPTTSAELQMFYEAAELRQDC